MEASSKNFSKWFCIDLDSSTPQLVYESWKLLFIKCMTLVGLLGMIVFWLTADQSYFWNIGLVNGTGAILLAAMFFKVRSVKGIKFAANILIYVTFFSVLACTFISDYSDASPPWVHFPVVFMAGAAVLGIRSITILAILTIAVYLGYSTGVFTALGLPVKPTLHPRPNDLYLERILGIVFMYAIAIAFHKIRKVLQRELVIVNSLQLNQQKVSSLKALSSGLAHELNNPIAILDGYLNIMKRSYPGSEVPSKDKKMIDQSLLAVERMTKLTKRFTAIFDDSMATGELVNLDKNLRDTLDSFDIKSGDVEVDIPKSTTLRISSGALDELVAELTINSAIATAECKIPEIRWMLKDSQLICEDNGGGFSAISFDDAVKPFTTKWKRSGLGLFGVKTLCENLGIPIYANRSNSKTQIILDLKKVII